jgi:hypothetical protein
MINNGVKKMKKGNVISKRFFSTLLATTLIASVAVSAPASFGADVVLVTTEAELIAAGINPAVTSVRIMADINLNTKLLINHSMSITCGETCTTPFRTITGQGIEITSGADVTLSQLNLNGLNLYPGEANYGISIRDGSHLTASYLNMTYNQTGLNANVAGFNVYDGSSLTLSNSSLAWGSNVSGLRQAAVYSQPGAAAVDISTSNFDFSSANTVGAYSCLLDVDGDLVADYPQLTLLNLRSDAYMQMQLSGMDSIANKQFWAYPNVSSAVGNNRVGIIGGTGTRVYSRFADNWMINLVDQVIPPVASEVSTVLYTLTSTTDTIFVDLADSYAYHFAYVDVKKMVLVDGKSVLRYVPVDLVVLDEFARATIKTLVGIKLGDIIRVSMAGYPDNVAVKWQLIK